MQQADNETGSRVEPLSAEAEVQEDLGATQDLIEEDCAPFAGESDKSTIFESSSDAAVLEKIELCTEKVNSKDNENASSAANNEIVVPVNTCKWRKAFRCS